MIHPSYEKKAAFFDAQARAPWADKSYGAVEHDKLVRLLELLEAAPGKHILEPGCGTGRLTAVLGKTVGPDGSVTALDISPRMVENACERTAGLDTVRVVRASLETCDLAAGSFDAVACHQVFPHFNDRPLALETLARCLRPSGLLVISHFIGRDSINNEHRKAGTVVEKDMLPDQATMVRLLERAGFRVDLLEDTNDLYFLTARLDA